MQTKRIVVVGGGPAGMMAAIRASQFHPDVTLIEKNPHLGKKLLLSGKGRCNLTNLCDLDSFLKRFSKNGQFLRDAFKKFFHRDLINFFEKRGLRLKVERQNRVFPVTDKADSILEVLRQELFRHKVKLIYRAPMKDIVIQDNKIKGLLLKEGRFIPAEKVILATGGVSYSFTGSSGEGIDLARRLGHRISRLRPGLVPLETTGEYPKLLAGLTLKNIRLKFLYRKVNKGTSDTTEGLLRGKRAFPLKGDRERSDRQRDEVPMEQNSARAKRVPILSDGKEETNSEIGELLFTDFGISGPLVLSLSGQVVDWLNEGKNVFVEIDLKPALSREQLDARLLREFKSQPKKCIKNILKNLLPKKLVDIVIDIAKILPDKQISHITFAERNSLVSLLKCLRLNILKPRPIEEAMITRGGVSLKDINPRTMESRLIKGLYFAGEMLDVDAATGGFNLQAAFSTGYLAGERAAL